MYFTPLKTTSYHISSHIKQHTTCNDARERGQHMTPLFMTQLHRMTDTLTCPKCLFVTLDIIEVIEPFIDIISILLVSLMQLYPLRCIMYILILILMLFYACVF